MRKLLIGGLAVALLASGSIAMAAIPNANGVINGCRDKVNGVVRAIDKAAGERCTATETVLNWNQKGPAGPAGPAGPVGPAGKPVTYLDIKDPRGQEIELTAADRFKTLSTFDDIEQGWYSLSAQISYRAAGDDGPATAGGSLHCSISGGSEEPLGGDGDSVVLTPTNQDGQFKLQTVVPVNNEAPVAMRCDVENLSAGDVVRVDEFNFLLTRLDPTILRHN